MAGYSGTPLPKKLGFKPGTEATVVGGPAEFLTALRELPDGARIVDDFSIGKLYDLILFFTTSASDLKARFPALAKRLQPAGGLWIAWPKKTSGVSTDLTEDVIRGIGLKVGLVDNKVCAIDETWSGLRFVIRIRDRLKKSARR
jgi:hypothetical protein